MDAPGETVKLTAFIVQGLAALSITSLNGLTAFTFAWPSYTLGMFTSNATVLAAPMSDSQAALLGSLSNVGALLATPLCTPALNTIGRKNSAILFGIPFVICWAMISVTESAWVVLAATALAGAGAAGQVVGSVYIAEISQDEVRGALTSTIVSGYFVGLLLSYILGGYLSYYRVVYAHLAMSVLYILSLMLLEESPVYLVKKSKEKDAAVSIAFYRRVEVSSREVEDEINKIKLQLDPRINTFVRSGNDITATMELIARDETKTQTESKAESEWSFLKRSPSSIRALSTALILMATMVMMGAVVLQVYAEPLFAEAVPSVSPNLSAILLAVVLLLASLLAALLVERLGRKWVMMASCVGAGACTLSLGWQLQRRWAPASVTALLIYSYCFVYNIGAAVVPFVITAEVFLPEVRSLCNSIVLACLWSMYFVTLVIFRPLVDRFGLGPVFYGFSVICFFGAVYCKLWLPETKGLSVDAIQPLFMKKVKKPNNTAKRAGGSGARWRRDALTPCVARHAAPRRAAHARAARGTPAAVRARARRVRRQPGREATLRRSAQQLQQAGAPGAQRQRRAHRPHQAQAEPAHRCELEKSDNDYQFMGRAELVRLQAVVGAARVRRSGDAARALRPHLATGHSAL